MNYSFSSAKEKLQDEILMLKEEHEELESMLSETKITIAESEDNKIRLLENNDRVKSKCNTLIGLSTRGVP